MFCSLSCTSSCVCHDNDMTYVITHQDDVGTVRGQLIYCQHSQQHTRSAVRQRSSRGRPERETTTMTMMTLIPLPLSPLLQTNVVADGVTRLLAPLPRHTLRDSCRGFVMTDVIVISQLFPSYQWRADDVAVCR